MGIIFFIFGTIMGFILHFYGIIISAKHARNVQQQQAYRNKNLGKPSFLSYIFFVNNRKTTVFTMFFTGILYFYSYYKIGFTGELFVLLIFISLLVIITISDVAYMIIPNVFLIFFGVFLVIGRIISPLDFMWDSLIGAILGFALLYLIAVVSKGGMGGGDVKLFFVVGLFLGVAKTLLTLFIASLLGVIVGYSTIILKKRNDKKPFPFGPYIAISALLSYFWGSELIVYYLHLF